MNKFKKLFATGFLLFGLTFSVAACAPQQETFVPPETGGNVVTINDAYDWNEDKTGSTRPELGGGYEPVLPPTEVTFTILEGADVRFAGGETSLTLPVGQLLSASDFDESTLDGHEIGGIALFDDDGSVRGFFDLGSFAPTEAVTILPYWAPENGEAYEFGSNQVGDYYYAADGTSLSGNSAYALTTDNVLIDGYMGKSISTGATLTENSYFRSVTVCEREAGQTYTYYYKFCNYGDETISFTVHQMFTGHAWANESTNVSSDVVTLAPGETSDWILLTDANESDDSNTLTLIRFNQDVKGFSLGVSMAVENSTVTEPATITLDLPDGFTVSDDYERNVMTNDLLVLPGASQITNNTGHNFLYWAYADGTPAVAGVRIQGDITLRPVLTEDAVISIQAPAGFTVSGYPKTVQTGDKLVLPSDEEITNNTGNTFIYWTYEDGTRAQNGDTVEGDIVLIPAMSENAKITLSLPAGFTVSSSYVTDVQTGETLTLPTADQITNNTGRTLLGWYNAETGEAVTSSAVVEGSMTIAPYFEHENGTALVPCTGADNATVPDYVGHYDENNNYTDWTDSSGNTIAQDEVFRTSTSYYGGQRGVLLESISDRGFVERDAFRCKTASNPAMDGVTTYRIYYSITNLGTESLSFRIYQVLSQANLGTAIDLGDMTFPVGETVTFSVDLCTSNNNLMTMFLFNEAADSVRLKIDMSMEQKVETAAVSVQLPDGLTLSEDYQAPTQSGGTFTLPDASQIEGLDEYDGRLIGWYNVATGAAITESTLVPAGETTIAPYFALGSENAEQLTVALPSDNVGIDPQSGITVTRGDMEYANYVYGRRLTSSGAYEEGAYFRVKTAYNVAEDSSYRIYYVITNEGTESVSFTVNQINSGTTIVDDYSREVSSLAVGESVSFCIDITGFTNTNLLSFFVMDSAGTGLNLHVAMAIEQLA